MTDRACPTNEQIEDYLDGLIDGAARDGFREHMEICPECRSRLARERQLRDALKSLPEPVLDPGFADRAFKHAARGARRRVGTLPLVRIAASILVVIAIGFVFRGAWGPGRAEWPEAYVRLNQPEEVRLVFNSGEDMENVTFCLAAPEGVEFVGFGKQRQIVWKVDLEKGENLLVLPVIARNRDGGSLIAEIRHDGRSRQFGLRLKVRMPGEGAGAGLLEGSALPALSV